MVKLEGVFSVLPTPFNSEGEVDKRSLEKVVELYVSAGVDGLTALGVTSEVARLCDRERTLVLDTVMSKVNGRIPVVVGTTANSVMTCIEYSKAAAAGRAAAVMVSPPRMPKLNSGSVIRHFSALAEDVDLPSVVQDYPVISGYAMEPSLLGQIAHEIPAARTMKMEDPPTSLKIARTLEESQDIRLKIFGGLGGVYLLEELMAGATGTMTGFAYPEILVEIVRLYRSGKVDRAAEMFYRCVPLMRFEFQEGIGMVIRKEILRRRGAMAHATVRAPGSALDAGTTSALDRLLKWVKKTEDAKWISDCTRRWQWLRAPAVDWDWLWLACWLPKGQTYQLHPTSKIFTRSQRRSSRTSARKYSRISQTCALRQTSKSGVMRQ